MCNDGGKIRRKRRRRKEGEVPVHSFTFPASMSHTWKSLISRDLCVTPDLLANPNPFPNHPLVEPHGSFRCTHLNVVASRFSLSLFSRILRFYSQRIVGGDLFLDNAHLFSTRATFPPFFPFFFYTVSLSFSALCNPYPRAHESTCLFNYLFARFNGWTRSPSYYAYLRMRLEQPRGWVCFELGINNKRW